jgi:hypothetical protein
MCNIIFQAGARIAIHAPKLKGLVDEYGFDLSPNMHTQIAIQEVYLKHYVACH